MQKLTEDSIEKSESFPNMVMFTLHDKLLNNALPAVLPAISEDEIFTFVSNSYGLRGKSAILYNKATLLGDQ